MQDHLKHKISDGYVIHINCMHYQCDKEFTLDDIRHFGSAKIFKKYLKFKENIDVEMDPNLKWCPRNGCINYVARRKGCCGYSDTAVC